MKRKQNLTAILALGIAACALAVSCLIKPAQAAEISGSGVVPVYAAGPDDTNHVAELDADLQGPLSYEGKTFVIKTSDGKYLDVSRTFMKARQNFIAAYNNLSDQRQKDALAGQKVFYEISLTPADQINPGDFKMSFFYMIERPSTHSFEFVEKQPRFNNSYTAQPGDIIHLFYRVNTRVPENIGSHYEGFISFSAKYFKVIKNGESSWNVDDVRENYLPKNQQMMSYELDNAPSTTVDEADLLKLETWRVESSDTAAQGQTQEHYVHIAAPYALDTDTERYSHLKPTLQVGVGGDLAVPSSPLYPYYFSRPVFWNIQNQLKITDTKVEPLGSLERLELPTWFERNASNYHEERDSPDFDVLPSHGQPSFTFNYDATAYTENVVEKQLPGYLFIDSTVPTAKTKYNIVTTRREETGLVDEENYVRNYRYVPRALVVDVKDPATDKAVPGVKFELWSADGSHKISDQTYTTDDEGKALLYEGDISALDAAGIREHLGLGNEDGLIAYEGGYLVNPGDYRIKLVAVPEGYTLPEGPMIAISVPVASADFVEAYHASLEITAPKPEPEPEPKPDPKPDTKPQKPASPQKSLLPRTGDVLFAGGGLIIAAAGVLGASLLLKRKSQH